MSMKRRTFALVSATALAVFLAAPLGVAIAQEVTLRSADIHPDGYPTVEAVKFFGEELSKATGGRIAVQVFHSAQLGQEKETIEQVKFGVIDLNRVNMGPFNNLVPETLVPALPFVFRDTAHMRAVMDGPVGEEILAAFESQGLVGLAFYDSGARSFYNSKKPIRTVADMAGLKVRVIQSDLFLDMVNAMGANATPMPPGEVYSALQTGVVDGAENNWPSYESFRHFEVAKYYSITQHSLSPEVLVMSKASYDKLSPEDQAAVKTAAKASVAKMRELWEARETVAEEKVRAAGVEVNEVDKAPFVEAMKPIYEKYAGEPKLADMVERIRATK
jgi:tripartite ATP-independent transporter DctP family solute receptor